MGLCVQCSAIPLDKSGQNRLAQVTNAKRSTSDRKKLVRFVGVYFDRIGRVYFYVQSAFHATFRAQIYACRVRSIFKFFSTECASTMNANVKVK
jgi:hypothetical protein